ncbi:MAG TPA: hypothetical protein VLH18_05785 [Candidatus Limnocylindrales bacterium]|nr:hypothetical protein [Candidatus Limnocylindrales bacterium]
MDFNFILNYLKDGSSAISARNAEENILKVPGLYSIFIDNPENFKATFITDYLIKKNIRIIYLGKATKSLKERLVDEDLRHKKPSTFFRAIGTVLNYSPLKGSLNGFNNQNNYKFTRDATTEIINWINDHLSVRQISLSLREIEDYEPSAIDAIRPPFNTRHNLEALPELAALRKRSREIAQGK